MPHLSEAASAAQDYWNARKEQLELVARIRVKEEGTRAAFAAVAAVCAFLAISSFVFWISWQIHEAGVQSWIIAVVSLAFFGGLAAILAMRVRTKSAHAALTKVKK